MSPEMTTQHDFNTRMSRALIDFMVEREVSQTRVAARLGRAQSYVSGRLTGKHHLSLDIVAAVADLTRTTPDALCVELVARARRAGVV